MTTAVPVMTAGAPLLTRLAGVREALAALPAEPDGEVLLAELTGHLIGRLSHPDAPALVAVTGPTGAGKSTLVNTLAGADVSPAGALRPTTRTPVLAHRPEDARWFPGHRRTVPAWDAVRPAPAPDLPPGVALLDTPVTRGGAGPLLAVADVWLFVTTATRYADAAAWEALGPAGSRELGVVLDRVGPADVPTVRSELAALLAARGLAGAGVLVVAESPLGGGDPSRLPANAVLPVRAWLEQLATGRTSRAAILHRSVTGSVAALAEPLAALTDRAGDRRLQRAVVELSRR